MTAKVKEIARAIGTLTPAEWDELRGWLDRNAPALIDVRIEGDVRSGRLDKAIDAALEDERRGRTRSL